MNKRKQVRSKTRSLYHVNLFKLVPKTLGIGVVVLLLIQLVVSNRLATTGVEITQIETEIADLTKQNSDLRAKIASSSSLISLEFKARSAGFTQRISPKYLTKEFPVAIDLP